jgi:hypothetical protein
MPGQSTLYDQVLRIEKGISCGLLSLAYYCL